MMTFVQMKLANKAIGQYWFDKGSMAFFNTKLIGQPDAFNLFITSETNPSDETRYTVRLFAYHSSKVLTVGDFHKRTKREAEALKTSLAKGLRSMGAREQHVFDSVVSVEVSDLGPDCYEFSNGEQSFVIRDGKIVN
jgi:hypothetical protein